MGALVITYPMSIPVQFTACYWFSSASWSSETIGGIDRCLRPLVYRSVAYSLVSMYTKIPIALFSIEMHAHMYLIFRIKTVDWSLV